jgi:hypothetical protein
MLFQKNQRLDDPNTLISRKIQLEIKNLNQIWIPHNFLYHWEFFENFSELGGGGSFFVIRVFLHSNDHVNDILYPFLIKSDPWPEMSGPD